MTPPLPAGEVNRRRLALLALGAAGLVTGLWAGLMRLGAVPAQATPDALVHGPLMVSGFLGVVISLERAVAARTGWAWGGPLCCGAGTLCFVAGQPAGGAVAVALGSAVVVAVLARVALTVPEVHHAVLTLAAVAWLVGNVLLALRLPALDVVGPWLVFLVGTIAAERLELTRVLPRARTTVALFLASFSAVFAGGLVLPWARDVGMRVFAGGALALAAWLFRHDVARRTVKQSGLTRFIAVALLAGYAWLAVAGALGLAFGHPLAGPRYDALLHALFVGFVFSMIFGHAPIILPAVLGVRLPFHARFYAHLVALHVALVLRVAGDLGGGEALRRAGAWGNVAAIAAFVGSSAVAVARRERVSA